MTSNANPATRAATCIAVRVTLGFMTRVANSALMSDAEDERRRATSTSQPVRPSRATLISYSIRGTSACQAASRAVQRCLA